MLYMDASSMAAENTVFQDKITAYIESVGEQFNGVVLVGQGDNDVLYERAFGHIDTPQLNSQSVIGSVSKQFTAAMVLKAVDEGLLSLHDPVGDNFENEAFKDVTFHQVLNNTSGIKDFDGPLRFTPGTQFLYSNAGFDLLGKTLVKKYKKPMWEIADSFFAKAGMTDSFSPQVGFIDEVKKEYPKLLRGYCFFEGGEEISTDFEVSSNPSGGYISTVRDLWQWNKALHEGHILSEEVYKQMITPSVLRVNRWGTIGYGYGIQIDGTGEQLELSHNGLVQGYKTTLLYYPHQRLSLVIIENYLNWSSTWTLEDQSRAFRVHDTIREIVKQEMIYSGQK